MTNHDRIRALRDEAGAAGDGEMVRLCDAALDGDYDAAARVESVLADVEAELAADRGGLCDECGAYIPADVTYCLRCGGEWGPF